GIGTGVGSDAPQSFKVLGSALMLMSFMEVFARSALAFPVLSTRTSTRMVDLLSIFNETTNKQILLAGACPHRLKTITAKHLALVHQSIHMIQTCLGPLLDLLVYALKKGNPSL